MTFKGLISTIDEYEMNATLITDEKGESVAFASEFPSYSEVIVRWAINDTGDWPETLDEVAADELSLLEGAAHTKYGAQYSEITGYLWTDNEATVGGHDLTRILESNRGKYLWMEVETIDTKARV
jgi:hypothetical protein